MTFVPEMSIQITIKYNEGKRLSVVHSAAQGLALHCILSQSICCYIPNAFHSSIVHAKIKLDPIFTLHCDSFNASSAVCSQCFAVLQHNVMQAFVD